MQVRFLETHGCCLLLLCCLLKLALGTGYLGCKINELLCEPDEYCYDDHALGRCLSLFDPPSKEDVFRYSLDHEDRKLVKVALGQLKKDGYTWDHLFTQCVLGGILEGFRTDGTIDLSVCDSLKDLTLEESRLLTSEVFDPRDVAFISYLPSRRDPESKYADEYYVPPPVLAEEKGEGGGKWEEKGERGERLTASQVNEALLYDKIGEELLNEVLGDPEVRLALEARGGGEAGAADDVALMTSFRERVAQKPRLLEGHRRREGEDRTSGEGAPPRKRSRGREPAIVSPFRERVMLIAERFPPEALPVVRELHPEEEPELRAAPAGAEVLPPEELETLLTLVAMEMGERDRQRALRAQQDNAGEVVIAPEKRRGAGRFHGKHGAKFFGEGPPLPPFNGVYPSVEKAAPGTEFLMYADEDYPLGAAEALVPVVLDEMGGPGDKTLEGQVYERLQRVDVKKPGPFFNKLRMQYESLPRKEGEAGTNGNMPKPEPAERELPQLGGPSPQRKKPASGPLKKDLLDPTHRFDIIDTSCVNVEFENPLPNSHAGDDFVGFLEKELRLQSGVFSNVYAPRHGTTLRFKVNPNRQQMNATHVSERIVKIKDELARNTGLQPYRTELGCADNKWSPIENTLEEQRLLAVTLSVCGALVVILLIVLGILLFRRNKHLREKLKNLTTSGAGEACQDYQDLCRARMAGKTPEKVEAGACRPGKEAGSPHSSRSSTSSWCEEPVLSNMDISTGHVVLAYMEDHLKNKDRLDLEWKALCAYEAEPCSTAVAEEQRNRSKNRNADCVPYDHSRILLNENANISGSNYINASSIMDHDPRNPAYIATQGPLASTAADFWQMVWEQGSLVIVMLTRLSESGKEMCHRYWPEDGSEVYHIYEVHLVSEHIWCEDYLVRSFYLKNLQSGETRTVTQLHFQTWPDGGIPSSTRALLEFRRKMNKSYRGRSSPIVVHCSDGCGRTGTFILVDMVLNRMAKGAKEIDIAATLEHIRDQRPRMVASKNEFEFALMAVAEEVHAILKAMPQQTQ